MYVYLEPWWNDTDRRDRRTARKSYLGVTLSTTNPTWIDLSANPGLRCERPVTEPWHDLDNRLFRRIFGPNREQVTGEWRAELQNAYLSPSVTRIVKSNRI
jgi:hypothetical protein